MPKNECVLPHVTYQSALVTLMCAGFSPDALCLGCSLLGHKVTGTLWLGEHKQKHDPCSKEQTELKQGKAREMHTVYRGHVEKKEKASEALI